MCQAAIIIEVSPPSRRYLGLGRVQQPVPVKRCLSALRFKQGHPTDFRVQEPSVALRVRQTQKQGRRLQTLERLMRKATAPCSVAVVQEAHQAWDAIIHASGFGKSFPHWVFAQAQNPWQDFPSMSQVSQIKAAVLIFARQYATQAWQRKRLLFNELLDHSRWILAFPSYERSTEAPGHRYDSSVPTAAGTTALGPCRQGMG